MNHPALGILEFNSIAQGMKAADEALKEARVEEARVVYCRPFDATKNKIAF